MELVKTTDHRESITTAYRRLITDIPEFNDSPDNAVNRRDLYKALRAIDHLDEFLTSSLGIGRKQLILGYYLWLKDIKRDSLAKFYDPSFSDRSDREEIVTGNLQKFSLTRDKEFELAGIVFGKLVLPQTNADQIVQAQVVELLDAGATEDDIVAHLGINPHDVRVLMIRINLEQDGEISVQDEVIKLQLQGLSNYEILQYLGIIPDTYIPPEERDMLVERVSDELIDIFIFGGTSFTERSNLNSEVGIQNETARRRLKKYGLTEPRAVAKERIVLRNLIPSEELGWIIGAISGGGNTGLESGTIKLDDSDPDVQQKFINYGEELFDTKVKFFNNGRYRAPAFCSRTLVRFFGDLRREFWPNTIVKRHPWILENKEYMWAFIQGYLDVKSTVTPKEITFYATGENNCSTLVYMLRTCGVESVRIVHRRGIPRGVKVMKIADRKLIANNLSSCVVQKEETLQVIRDEDIEDQGIRIPQSEILNEWKKFRQMHPGTITWREIEVYKKSGDFKFCSTMLIRRFGKTTTLRSGVSWTIALSRLDAAIQESAI